METPLKILILEDVRADVALMERALKKEGLAFTSKHVDKRDEFIDALRQFTPDVVLSDLSLPQFNSTEALKICKGQDRKIPFILVTGSVSEEFAVDSLKEGADDYVLKSNLRAFLPPSSLPHCITIWRRRSEKQRIISGRKTQN